MSFKLWKEMVDVISRRLKTEPLKCEAGRRIVAGYYDVRVLGDSLINGQLTPPYSVPDEYLILLYLVSAYDASRAICDEEAAKQINALNVSIIAKIDVLHPISWFERTFKSNPTWEDRYKEYASAIRRGEQDKVSRDIAYALDMSIKGLAFNEIHSNTPAGFIPSTTIKRRGLYEEMLWVWSQYADGKQGVSISRSWGSNIGEYVQRHAYPHFNSEDG